MAFSDSKHSSRSFQPKARKPNMCAGTRFSSISSDVKPSGSSGQSQTEHRSSATIGGPTTLATL